MALFDSVPSSQPGQIKTLAQLLAYGRAGTERRARAAIELWIEELPHEARGEMTSRLLADDRDFQGAFFELFLNALFRRLGYVPQLHPQVSFDHDRRPDFLMWRAGEPRFYLEATVVEDRAPPKDPTICTPPLFTTRNSQPQC